MASTDLASPLLTEQLYNVKPAASLCNDFADTTIPQNPGLAENNWSGSHQDSYCSESVSLEGPTSDKLRIITRYNPYGFAPIMGCNQHNVMVGMSFSDGYFHLITFDTECNILTTNRTGKGFQDISSGSFAGGYFFLDQDDNAIAVGNNKIKAYPTGRVGENRKIGTLRLLWKTSSVVTAITGNDDNVLYSTMPVWSEAQNTYWCLLGGRYNVSDKKDVTITESAYIAVVHVPTSSTDGRNITPQVLAKMELNRPFAQYNNNTFAATEDSAVFVTNGLDQYGRCTSGFCYRVKYESNALQVVWQAPYENSGFLKPGMKNVGSGTTPTVMVDTTGNRLVAITDNAYPRMNVVAYNYSNGRKRLEEPVFSNMLGSNEASVIGVRNSIYVPNNFGHTVSFTESQYVSNEPGLTKVEVGANIEDGSTTIWEQNRYTFFAMNMLARKSGIIFAHSAEWCDEESAIDGGVYYILAIDSFDGRVIWRIPIGRGRKYCHEYGGIYFDRIGDKIFMGTNNYLVSIQNYDQGRLGSSED